VTGDDLLASVRDGLRERIVRAADPRVVVGDRLVFVEVTDPEDGRLAGLAHRPNGPDPGGWPAETGELAACSGGEDPLERAVGIATLNAVSVPVVDWQVGDPMAALAPDVDVVATVGLFRPAFGKFDDVTVRVVERDPPETVAAPDGVTVTTHAPSDAPEAFADADVCFVTGSALVYGGLAGYLDALADAGVSPVVLVGATASFWPRPAFDAGVDLVAGARVDAPERVRRRVLCGDCASDLHDDGVSKVFVAAGDDSPKLTLAGTYYRETKETST